MAKRTVTRRFDSTEVQGKGTYVILSSLKVGERRDYAKKKDKDGFSALEWGIALLTKHVVEWNWVDEDGKALPVLKDDKKVIEGMTDPESEFLMSCLMTPDAKN